MRLILFIFILALIIVGFYSYIAMKNQFDVSFKIVSLNGNLVGILAGLIQGQQEVLNISYQVVINNKSLLSLIFTNLIVTITDTNGNQLGQTPTDVTSQAQFNLLPNAVSTYNGEMDLLINANTTNLAVAALQGTPVTINYNISLNVTPIKIPVSFKGTYNYTK